VHAVEFQTAGRERPTAAAMVLFPVCRACLCLAGLGVCINTKSRREQGDRIS
jgi:hypothetical protein